MGSFIITDTLETARKVAEDSQYTSTEEENLGRGRRKRFSKKVTSSDSDSSSPENVPQRNKKKSGIIM